MAYSTATHGHFVLPFRDVKTVEIVIKDEHLLCRGNADYGSQKQHCYA